jgi:hypothetical protein
MGGSDKAWLSLAALLACACATGISAPVPSPKAAAEAAAPAVDLAKAATDPKLAEADATNRKASENNLKRIGLAFHAYAEAHGHLPADVTDKKGKPILSWRARIGGIERSEWRACP